MTIIFKLLFVSSGCRSGAIHNHDVRIADHHIGTLLSHMQEVCGLQWSPDGSYLASGGNDNLSNIWDTVSGHSRAPVHRITGHQAAVKVNELESGDSLIIGSFVLGTLGGYMVQSVADWHKLG